MPPRTPAAAAPSPAQRRPAAKAKPKSDPQSKPKPQRMAAQALAASPALKAGAARKMPLAPAAPAAAARPLPASAPAASGGDDVETRIYNTVFESVMTQRLTPGTKLPEASLCELFGVSRSVVRKVLQRLAHDHIVQLRPNRGAIVAVPTPEETRHIFQARRALEAAIVPLAVEHATPQDLAALREQLRQEHEAMHRFDQPAWVRLASAFHLRLSELARNPILHSYLVEIISRCSLIVALYERPGNAACEHDEHERIVDCIGRGDAAGAVALMDEHLRELERHINLQLATPERSLAQRLGLA